MNKTLITRTILPTGENGYELYLTDVSDPILIIEGHPVLLKVYKHGYITCLDSYRLNEFDGTYKTDSDIWYPT